MIKLHLLQDIQYQSVLPMSDLKTSYAEVIANLFDIPVGVEILFDISYESEDQVNFQLKNLARKEPPTPEDKMAVDNGLSIPMIKDPKFSIFSGDYGFEQLLLIPEPERLNSVLYRFCTRERGELYLRLIREKTMEFVLQVLVNN